MIEQAHGELIDVLPEVCMLVGGSGTILRLNRSATTRLGPGTAAWIGRDLQEMVDYPAADELHSYLRWCSRSRQPVIGPLRLRDGPVYRTEGAVVRPRTADHDATILLRLEPRDRTARRFRALYERIDEMHAEIGRRKRSEEALEEQREWLRVTLSTIGDAVITTDVAGRITFVNPRAERLTGWSAEEAHGHPVAEVVRIEDERTCAPVADPVFAVLSSGAVSGPSDRAVLVTRAGERIAIENAAAPIRNGRAGYVRGVVLVFHDLQDRRRLERELECRLEHPAEADRARSSATPGCPPFARFDRFESGAGDLASGRRASARVMEIGVRPCVSRADVDRRTNQFLAMLAHELRNPLAPLQSGLHLLVRNRGDPELVDRIHGVMDRQVRQLARLVTDLLEVSRVSRGKIRLDLATVDLVEVVVDTAEDHRTRLLEAGLEFTRTAPDHPVWVRADRVRISQVLANLLENAMKFTPSGGAVRLVVEEHPDEVTVSVTDTGIGIPAELQPHLFQAFVQGDDSLARKHGGLGLGLALVKGLVELHGGRARASSGPDGIGTTVSFDLNRADPPEATAPEPQRRATVGRKVLVVDDNRDAAEMLGLMLQMAGYSVVLGFSGGEALALARAEDPEVVLCDIGLPDMDGLEVARRLRGETATAAVRLIAVTGYSDDRMKREVAAAGFDAHLVKPVDPEVLLSAVGA